MVAKAAWAMGRGIRPLFSFSEGRTFRTAIQLRRRPSLAKRSSSGCGPTAIAAPSSPNKACCACAAGRPAVAATTRRPPYRFQDPWLGPLQDPLVLGELLQEAEGLPEACVASASRRLLEGLRVDDGLPVSCWPVDALANALVAAAPLGCVDRVSAG